jgi:hydroxymethylbilane synthase
VEAERSFLAELGGGCDLPVGAYAVATGGGEVSITGLVASLDGRSVLRETRSGADGVALGAEVARHLLALTPDWTT